MKNIKKILAAAAAAMTVASFGTLNAFAAKKNYSFSVTTSQNSGVAFSAGNAKSDDEQTAYIVTQKGNIGSGDSFWMCSCSSANVSNRVTNWKKITSNSATYTVDYFTWRGKNTTNYLCADTDKYQVSVEGYWYS